MDSHSREEVSLPSARAFVLQLYADAAVESDHFPARVEHIASGQATHVQTVAELLAFIARVLAEGRGRAAGEV